MHELDPRRERRVHRRFGPPSLECNQLGGGVVPARAMDTAIGVRAGAHRPRRRGPGREC